jgi:enoyl-CoA hydratase/carnithine racemase
MFTAVSLDPQNKVLIRTGTGDWLIKDADFAAFGDLGSGLGWSIVPSHGRRMVQSYIDCDLPTIAAVNGPAPIHPELAVLADIVVASDQAWFQDPHIANGVAPGDGIHAAWIELLGVNRARHFLLTGQKLDARQAHDLGVVAEVVPPGSVQERA